MNVKWCLCAPMVFFFLSGCTHENGKGHRGTVWENALYGKPSRDMETRWFSPENPTGAKGVAGKTNRGAKGNAFYIVQPGATQTILDVEGAGIIQRMWMSGTIAISAEQRRGVVLNMYWDGAEKPAVSAPIGDFFGNALGLMRPFESALCSNPEGRSFLFTVPMPYRNGALIEIVNESSSQVLFWYDINVQTMDRVPDNAMYFHSYWKRDMGTQLGEDFEILPQVKGTGRFLGSHIGVIGDQKYLGTWFGEGEVKFYLDGDVVFPTLQGTGTEDYIGTGWGQGEFHGQHSGSLVSDKTRDLYAFYRYHITDAIYFHSDCRVTLQQMGSATTEQVKQMKERGVGIVPVWQLQTYGQELGKDRGIPMEHIRLLEDDTVSKSVFERLEPGLPTNFFRSDDVSATSYFYLDSPMNDLPALQSFDERILNMEEKVWK